MSNFLAVIASAIVFFVVCAFTIKSCQEWSDQLPTNIAHRQQVEADKLPRKVNESNGCEVWAFNPGDRWLYFTRCGAKTETTNAWDECRSVTTGKTTRTECTPRSAVISQEKK